MSRRRRKTSNVERKKFQMKELQCTTCDRLVEVDEDIVAVTCWECAVKRCPLEIKQKPEPSNEPRRPKGWRLYKVYVDEEKNVFHLGVEKPELKGTLEPTVIVVKPKKTRAEKDMEQAKKDAKLAAKFKKKQLAKKKDNEQKATASAALSAT